MVSPQRVVEEEDDWKQASDDLKKWRARKDSNL